MAGLKSGLDSAFRRAEKAVIEENIKDLAREVLENDDLTEKQREDLRIWHLFLRWFVELPEQIIQSVTEMPDAPATEYDPFHKVKEGIIGK